MRGVGVDGGRGGDVLAAVEHEQVGQGRADVVDEADVRVLGRVAGHEQALVHVAVGEVEADEGVPAADGDEGGGVVEREAVVGEEADGPFSRAAFRRGEGLGEDVEHAGIQGFVSVCGRVEVVFLGQGDDVHVGPEVVGPLTLEGGVEVEVLQLGEGEEGGGLEDGDVEERGQAGVVEVEGVL